MTSKRHAAKKSPKQPAAKPKKPAARGGAGKDRERVVRAAKRANSEAARASKFARPPREYKAEKALRGKATLAALRKKGEKIVVPEVAAKGEKAAKGDKAPKAEKPGKGEKGPKLRKPARPYDEEQLEPEAAAATEEADDDDDDEEEEELPQDDNRATTE